MNLESPWTVYRTRFLVRARQLTEPLVFTDPLGREQSGRPGDYLVESSDGIRRIINMSQGKNGARDVLARSLSRASQQDRAQATV